MQPAAVIAERFVVEDRVDEGGMGIVFRAHDRLTGTKVALKVLHGIPDGVAEARFSREATVLAELRHPGIVRYVAHGRTPAGQLYLAMQWLEGLDLHHRLRDEPPTIAGTLIMLRAVCEALAYAHEHGVVHRDLKPGNIFLVEGDLAQAKVLDFGLARRAVATTRMVSEVGAPLGTPGYMAPEQARGEAQVGPAADVFSLGCVLFECLTGRPPFVARDLMSVLAKILLEEAAPLRELRPDAPAALEGLLARMLAKDPRRRPADAIELGRALDALGDLQGRPPIVASMRPREALTGGEQRLLSVVLLGIAQSVDEDAPTRSEALDARSDALQAQGEAFGARVERLLDGSIVAALSGGGSATDRAAQAARCALAFRAIDPDASMALATGRGTWAGRWPVGEVIDRAARVLQGASGVEIDEKYGRPIRLDRLTAGLLDLAFDVGGDAAGLVLRGERPVIEPTRTVLGVTTPCVGRDRELGVLDGVFAECRSEPVSRAVVVVGPPGIGKSRLRHELVRRLALAAPEIEVLTGRGDPISAGSPFAMIAPALRRAAGILDGEPLSVRRQKLGARVARHVPDAEQPRVTEFLGELIGVPVADERASVPLRAARRDPPLMADSMRRAFEDYLAAECAAGPVLLALDDLHWGDLPSVQFVDAALRHCADLPLMVVAFARPEVEDLFPELWRARSPTEIHLSSLGRRAAEKLVRAVLGAGVDAELVASIVDRADGNALFLEELMRVAAVSHGKPLVVPETLLAMVQARLEALDPSARRVLRAASVFGRRFWRGAALSLLGDDGSGGHARDAVELLVSEELVVRRGEGRFPGEEELTFRHALVRDAAYAMLTDSDRALGHRLAAQWLEAAGETDAMVLAEHCERGGEVARAIERYRTAAEHALEANDLAGAIERAERGVGCGAQGESLGMLRLVQAHAHSWRGASDLGEKCAREALSLLRPESADGCAAMGAAGIATVRLGRIDAFEADVERLRATAIDPDAGVAWAIELVRFAVELFNAGRAPLAEAALEAVAPFAGDPSVAARLLHARASQALFAGDPAAALGHLESAARAFEDIGDLRHACLELGNAGYVTVELGDPARAEQLLRESIAGAQRMGLLQVTYALRANLALALVRRGAPEAVDLARDAAETMRAQGAKRLEGAARLYLSMALAAAGDPEGAEREARAAAALTEIVPPLRAYALGVLGDVLSRSGRVAEALTVSVEAMRVLESLGGLDAGEALVRCVHAEALHAGGDRPAAVRAIGVARERLLARAAKIGDATMRRAFLENVPDNARTLRLADEWAPG